MIHSSKEFSKSSTDYADYISPSSFFILHCRRRKPQSGLRPTPAVLGAAGL
jgi:hypothetical protein